MTQTDNSKHCCPVPDKAKWHDKTHVWEEKLFIMKEIKLFMHMPNPKKVGQVIEYLWNKAKETGAATSDEDFLLLAHESSPWKGEYYLNVTKEIPGEENVKMSGTFISKIFDGPYNAVPKWVKEFEQYAKEKGLEIEDYWFHYATCPKCMKKTGHNYVIAFGKVKE